ncbi:MAG: HEAT repeat domain-containing protein [Planctomycetota bacterium]
MIRLAKESDHSFLKRNATFALRLYDDEAVLPVLRELVKSKDMVVRNRALAGLIRWRDRKSVPWLVERLEKTDDRPFQCFLAHALGVIRDPRAVGPILRTAKRRRSSEFDWVAIPALGRIRVASPDVMDFLKQMAVVYGKIAAGTSSGRRYGTTNQMRGVVLIERTRIALACLGDKNQQRWIKGAKVQTPNEHLWKEAREAIRRPLPPPPPKPKPIAKEKKEGPPPPVPPTPQEILEKHREDLLQYRGVVSVTLQDDTIVIVVETRGDAADLRMLVGPAIEGVPVRIEVQ